MVKRDRSRDNMFWSFGSADFNQVIMTKDVKFFMTGAMWRSAPGPHSSMKLYENNSKITCFEIFWKFQNIIYLFHEKYENQTGDFMTLLKIEKFLN